MIKLNDTDYVNSAHIASVHVNDCYLDRGKFYVTMRDGSEYYFDDEKVFKRLLRRVK